MQNGLINSTGWNLGRNGKSNHLFEPLTSSPTKGTRKSKKNDKIKKNIDIFIRKSSLTNENINMIDRPNKINTKCFIKK